MRTDNVRIGLETRSHWGPTWYGLLLGLPLLHAATLWAGPPDKLRADDARSTEVSAAESGESPTASSPVSPSGARPNRRLPRFFGKLDLAAEQRERIFKIQEQYEREMERLEIELAELRMERESQVRQVLSDDQRTRLNRLMDEPRVPGRPQEKLSEQGAPSADRSAPGQET